LPGALQAGCTLELDGRDVMTMMGITKLANWPCPTVLSRVEGSLFANSSACVLAGQNLIGHEEHKRPKSGLSLTQLRYFKSFRIRTYKQYAHDLEITPLESSKVSFPRPKCGLVSPLESALTSFPHLKFFRICTYIKRGGGVRRTVNLRQRTPGDASAAPRECVRTARLSPERGKISCPSTFRAKS